MNIKTDKGVAGLTILLSLVVMLFMIGLIVMIFSLMGTGLRDATYTSTSGTVYKEVLTQAELSLGSSLDANGNRSCSLSSVSIQNGTSGATLSSGNYSYTGCTISNLTSNYVDSSWYVNYTYTYDADNTGTQVINDTTSSIAGVTDWFDIFIVIGAMVVLILLTVIIITAIRGSGMVAGGSPSSNAGKIGTA